MRNSDARIGRFIEQMDLITQPQLTNGEMIYMCTCLLEGAINKAPADVAGAIRTEVVLALKGGPHQLLNLCAIPRRRVIDAPTEPRLGIDAAVDAPRVAKEAR